MIRQRNRHHRACPGGLVTGSQNLLHREVIAATGACPRGATIVSRAVSRGSTGTSPVAAIDIYAPVTGRQSSIHRDKPGGDVTATSGTLI
ncbi:MAG TPA: hypothetical protein VG099_29895 [Gemmataceae bacterium]|nr:hypothetical protein [Gemmataceae bacterium]